MCRLFPRPQGKELFYKSASKEINNKSWHLCPRGTSTKADKTHIATAIHSLEFSSLSIAFSLNGSLAFTEGLRKQPLKAQYNPTIKLRVEFLLSFLKYSWFTMLLISAVQQGDSVIYIYTHSFLYPFPLWFITGYGIEFPVLYSRTLLFIHPICHSLHLLTQTPSTSLPHPPSPSATTSLISMSACLFLFHR